MSDLYTGESFVFRAQETGVAEYQPIPGIEVMQTIEGIEEATDPEQAFYALLEKYNTDAAVALRGVVGIINDIEGRASKDLRIPVAVLSDTEAGDQTQAIIGNLSRDNRQIIVSSGRIAPDTRRMDLNVVLDASINPLLIGFRGKLPDKTHDSGKYTAPLHSINFTRDGTKSNLWNVRRGFADIIAIGAAVPDILERDGFGKILNAYQAGNNHR